MLLSGTDIVLESNGIVNWLISQWNVRILRMAPSIFPRGSSPVCVPGHLNELTLNCTYFEFEKYSIPPFHWSSEAWLHELIHLNPCFPE